MKLRTTLILLMMLCGSAWAADEPTAAISPDELAARGAVAERLAQMAQLNLAGRAINAATLHQSATLLEAASRMNPREPRFLRLLAEARLQIGGVEGRSGALDALKRYRELQPNDESAQVQVIDLTLARMDRADEQMKYVQQLMGLEALPAPVKAHVAVVGARLCLERSASEQADSYLSQALTLFPLSPEALKLKYQRMAPNAPAAEHVALLLQILRSNPSQPAAMIELAQVLADGGVVDASLNWYQYALGVTQRLGLQPDQNQLVGYASELVVADQLRAAEPLLQKLLETDPSNADAGLLLTLVTRRIGDAEKLETVTGKYRTAILIRLNRISAAANEREPSSDAVPSVDVQSDLKKLKELARPDWSNAYAAGLADLAWLELYFQGKPDAAQPYIAALQELLPPDSATLARLEGWSFLVQGKHDEAKVKLSAVSETDPLAALGMLRVQSAQPTPEQAREETRKLLNQNASGVIGALLIESVRDKFGLMPAGPDTAAIQAELDKFPRRWLDIVDYQKARDFYSIKAETIHVGHSFAEPIIASVTITNTSDYDITIGPDSALRPDLWFDVQLKGLFQRAISGVAFDRFGQRLVLHPKESATQTLRLDQGELAALLNQNPTVQVPLYFSVVTNPMTLPTTAIGPGPGGQRVQFMRVVERSPSPPSAAMQKAIGQLTNGAGDDRIYTLALLATYSRAMAKVDDPNAKGQAAQLADLIRKSTGDRAPTVAALATYYTALLAPADTREGVIRMMLDSDFPLSRVLGLMAMQEVLDPAARKSVAATMADKESDKMVKELAMTVMEVADMPATTQPADKPTDQPAAAPGASASPG